MKNLLLTIISFLFVLAVSAQVDYYYTTTNGTYSSAIGQNNDADGDNAFVGGVTSEASGQTSFAFGSSAEASATNSIAFGLANNSNGVSSLTLGGYLTAEGTNSFVIGKGLTSSYRLINTIPNSIMFGMNATKPTLFISPTYGLDKTGKVAIGNTTDPLAKLHIKADQNEPASLFIEPFAFSEINYAELWMGTEDYGLRAAYGRMYFKTGGNYIFNSAGANVGIGTLNPLAKLQVNGDIFINDGNAGLILKSPDGQCWKITVNNSGELTTTSINCDLTTGNTSALEPAQEVIRIYPNPANNTITIGNTYNYTVFATLRAIDGTLIVTQKLQTGDNTLNLEYLTTGTYIVTILDSQNQVLTSEKIMKK
jgi:hypothetical protein